MQTAMQRIMWVQLVKFLLTNAAHYVGTALSSSCSQMQHIMWVQLVKFLLTNAVLYVMMLSICSFCLFICLSPEVHTRVFLKN